MNGGKLVFVFAILQMASLSYLRSVAVFPGKYHKPGY